MFSNCKDCQTKDTEIKALKKEVERLQAKIATTGQYCQDNANRANKMLETNLGMRTYGKMIATYEHLTYIAKVLGFDVAEYISLSPWKKFREF